MNTTNLRVRKVRVQLVIGQIDQEILKVGRQSMADLRFMHDHNMTAFLGEPPAKHSEFQSMIEGLILSPVNYAIMVVTSFIRDIWSSVEESIDADGNISTVGKIQGHSIIISEQIIRDCLQFGDKESDPVELDQDLCLSGRKGGYDVLNQTLSSCMVALALGEDFNFSKMIFLDMHANIKGRRKERFLAFPKFIQIILDKRHPNLERTFGSLEVKRMRDDIFGYLKMSKRGKKQYIGQRPLIKFGRFVGEGLDEDMPGTPVAIVAEEHDV
ncbi:hypothetical protein R6Q59_012396 [Mikania micrantha]